jgi:ubiquinone/menaquinone biosynthesis C-methylase UbiE
MPAMPGRAGFFRAPPGSRGLGAVMPRRRFVPALRFSLLSTIYDPFIELLMREPQLRTRLVAQAGLRPGDRVLDLGCGTATLTILAQRSCPVAVVVGLDADPRILAIARRKVARAGLAIPLDEGIAYDLPYADGVFDRVMTNMVLHHLTADQKRRTMHAVRRVLRPGAELQVADFGPPRGWLPRPAGKALARLEPVSDDMEGRLPALIRDAGFQPIRDVGTLTTVSGTIHYLAASSPSSWFRGIEGFPGCQTLLACPWADEPRDGPHPH